MLAERINICRNKLSSEGKAMSKYDTSFHLSFRGMLLGKNCRHLNSTKVALQ